MRALREFWAELKDSFFMAMGAVAAHKLRSALTLLGVLVGVFSIILVMTGMRAMKAQIESELSSLGGQTFIVQTWPEISFEGPQGWAKYRRRKRINVIMGQEVISRITLARNVGLEDDGITSGTMISRFAKSPPTIWLTGDSPGCFPCQNWIVHEGRGLIDADVDEARDVCVLGSTLGSSLFPFGSAVGQQVTFNSVKYNVVGVLEPRGGMSGGHQDDFAIIPVTTGVNRYENKRFLNLAIMVQARSAEEYEETVDQVRGIMRVIRKVPPGEPDDFEIISADSLMATLEDFTRSLRIGISIVSSIALLAAGIGIMNIMLVSVTERTREIGVRRAIGAKKRNIMTQFIMEAIVLCELGGVLGVAAGVGAGDLWAMYVQYPNVLPVDWIFIGLGICSLVGIIFGTYPAWKAANLDPIESLRYE